MRGVLLSLTVFLVSTLSSLLASFVLNYLHANRVGLFLDLLVGLPDPLWISVILPALFHRNPAAKPGATGAVRDKSASGFFN